MGVGFTLDHPIHPELQVKRGVLFDLADLLRRRG